MQGDKESFTAVEVCTGSLLEARMEVCEPSAWKSFFLWQEPLISGLWSWTALYLWALFPTFHSGGQVPWGLFGESKSVMLENKNKIAHLGPLRPFLWSHRRTPCTPPFLKSPPNFLFNMFDVQAPWHILHFTCQYKHWFTVCILSI